MVGIRRSKESFELAIVGGCPVCLQISHQSYAPSEENAASLVSPGCFGKLDGFLLWHQDEMMFGIASGSF